MRETINKINSGILKLICRKLSDYFKVNENDFNTWEFLNKEESE